MKASFFHWRIGRVHCYSLFPYNDTIRSLIYQFKGCGDFELSSTFFSYVLPFLRIRFHDYVIVPAPSSQSHNETRGFNQVEAIAGHLGLPIACCLTKEGESKQSDLPLRERGKVNQSIHLKEGFRLAGKKLLLLDDVYTTGNTVKACLRNLAKTRPKKMVVLTVAKTLKRSPP